MLVIGSFSHVPFTWADKGKWITPLFPCDTDHILLRSILYCVVLPYCAHCIYPVCFDYSLFFFFTIYIHVLLPIKKKKIHLVDVNDHKRSSADLPQASFFHIHGHLLAFLWNTWQFWQWSLQLLLTLFRGRIGKTEKSEMLCHWLCWWPFYLVLGCKHFFLVIS